MSVSKNKMSDYDVGTNLNGIYRGVVENNEDPLSRCRCQVRIFGIHTENLNKSEWEGLPTEELIWAEPAMPLSMGGGTSGYGGYGVVQNGTQVFVFFEGGHLLQPRYFAWSIINSVTSATANTSIAAGGKGAAGVENQTAEQAQEQQYESEQTINKDWKDASGIIREENRPNVLGAVCRQNEGFKGDPGYVANNKNDVSGGASYGIYQFASKAGGVNELQKHIPADAKAKYPGLASKDFKDANGKFAQDFKKWSKENPTQSISIQDKAAQSEYYTKSVPYFKRATGVDPGNNRAVQEAIFSASIQHGVGGAAKVFASAGIKPGMTDLEIITAINKERSNGAKYQKTNVNLRKAQNSRFTVKEPKILNPLCTGEVLGGKETKQGRSRSILPSSKITMPDFTKPWANWSVEEALKNLVQPVQNIINDIKNMSILDKMNFPEIPLLGFFDKTGKYPQANRENEQNVHRLLRGEDKTYVEHKKENIEKNNKTFGGNIWDEPEPSNKTKYPDNAIIATPGGVSLEMDSTENAQSFRVTHPSNSYQEFSPEGNLILRSNVDSYFISKVNMFKKVGGDDNITVIQNRLEFIGGFEKSEVIMGREKRILGNNKEFIGRDHEELITGKSTEIVIDSKYVKVMWNSTEHVSGIKSVTTQSNFVENTSGTRYITATMIRLNASMIFLN